jgi:hypothetical protein
MIFGKKFLNLIIIQRDIVTNVNRSSCKLKVKETLEEALKTRGGGRRGIALLFNFGVRWRWVFNATPHPLYPR